MKRRALAFVLSGAMLLSTVPSAFAAEVITVDDSQAAVTVQAGSVVASGNCGKNGANVTWSLDSEGTLTISGTGAIDDFGTLELIPWYDSHRTEIKTINISNGVTGIGMNAFYHCINVENVTIPDSVTYIGSYAFTRCSKLKSATMNGVTSIGYESFNSCSQMTSVSMNSVTYIGTRAFNSCDALTNIELPNGLNFIGEEAFYSAGLKSIEIPDGVTQISKEAFRNCTSLTSVNLPKNLTSIGESAFRNCENLPSIELPNTVTSIGDGAFATCESLTSINIPDSVTNIGKEAFQKCYKLTSITIPSSVTRIQSATFKSCTGLTSIELPDTVTRIDSEAFYGCTSLTSIDIPKDVTKIGRQAFYDCSALKTINFCGDKPTDITNNAFSGVSAVVRYPEGNTTWTDTALGSFNGTTETWNPENGTVNHVWQNGVCETCNETCTHTGGTATCTAKAKCEICGELYGEVNADNHTGKTVWTTTETEHTQTWDCCDATVVDTEKHEWDKGTCTECDYVCQHKGGKATCTAKATCDICGEPYGEIDTDNHTGNKVWTTTETEHTQTWDCCGATVVDTEKHEWDNGTCKKCKYVCRHKGGTATCTEQAKCDICGELYGEVDATHHTENKVWTTTETEHTQTWDCCGATVVDTEKHEWKNGTCEECGYNCKHAGGMSTCTSRAKCKYCGQSYGTVDSDYHTGWRVWETTETTHQQKYTCCGEVVVKTENHKWKDKVCEICGYGCTHNEEIISAVPATCTENGLTAGKKCTVCGVTLEAQEVVKALGHTAVTDPLVKATRTKDGKTEGSHCSTCGEVLTEQQTIYKVSKIKLKKKYHTYYGKKHKPGVIVQDSQGNTIDKSNYKVKYYGNRKKVGKYKVVVTLKGDQYKGKKTLYFFVRKK